MMPMRIQGSPIESVGMSLTATIVTGVSNIALALELPSELPPNSYKIQQKEMFLLTKNELEGTCLMNKRIHANANLCVFKSHSI